MYIYSRLALYRQSARKNYYEGIAKVKVVGLSIAIATISILTHMWPDYVK